jgi:hypothetical protein
MCNSSSNLLVAGILLGLLTATAAQQQKATSDSDDENSRARTRPPSSEQVQSATSASGGAFEAATRLRRSLGPLPPVVRGQDGLLNPFGQRATQSQLVTSTNVKDPVTDTFAFTPAVPLEASEPVRIPAEQFSVRLSKFYSTVPSVDQFSSSGWHATIGSPLFSLKYFDGIEGVRAASPGMTLGGPLGKRVLLLDAFSYRLSKTTIQNEEAEPHDSRYEAYDWNSHSDIDGGKGHSLSARLSLFAQNVGSATLAALISPEASPDFSMGGGSLYFSDSLNSKQGAILESVVAFRRLHVRLLPHGVGPMLFIEQGELEGNYFNTFHEATSRFEWRETLRLPVVKALGQHYLSFGGGYSRSGFDSTRVGSTIVLRGEEEDELTAIINFAGSPVESLTMNEGTLWIEDRWAPTSRYTFTLGQRYDRTSVSRTNEWAPRAGFAIRPFSGDRTVVRGGLGLFFDVIPLTAGTFENGQRRVTQFFDDGIPISGVEMLSNIVVESRLRTAHVLGWNLELDHQLMRRLLVRLRGEERRGRDLLLVTPDKPGSQVTALLLSDTGRSISREFEATASFRATRWGQFSVSYTRSSALSDTNTFATSLGTFEKTVISTNRYAHSRADAPNRFIAWGEFRMPGEVLASPAIDLRTGFPFAFVDADANVTPIPDFGRFPRFASIDLGLHRDFALNPFDRAGKLRLGFSVYNLANRFNPREALMGETPDQKLPVLRGFLNSSGRAFRAAAVFSF